MFASQFVRADEQWRGERFKDIKKASEKHRVKMAQLQTSAKTLALIQLQSQASSQNTSFFLRELLPLYPAIYFLFGPPI